ncbi:hypothetical protein T265_12543, partial [Opisthorchis viverrini]
MAHRDFATEHYATLLRDLNSVNIPRRSAVRGSPSNVEQHFPSNSRESIGELQPEIKLLEYTSLPEYKSSDHRPVVGSFEFAVPSRWFSLPVSFIEPMGKASKTFNCQAAMPPEGSTRAEILPGCPCLGNSSRGASIGWPKWLEREFTDRKIRGSNPTYVSRLPLSRLGQPGSIPALVLPSDGMAARHRRGATAELNASANSLLIAV